MPLVYAHEILSQCDMYFLSGSHFSKFIYVAFLSTWLNLEPSYLAWLCINTVATHREEVMHLLIASSGFNIQEWSYRFDFEII